MIMGLVGIALTVIILAATTPTVATEVFKVSNGSGGLGLIAQNVTPAAAALTSLLTLTFVAIGIVTVVKLFGTL